jgi:hypothetical protein
MQNAQNTFYITLRNRLAALNPDRTIYLRGVTRPGILVEGNELVQASPYSDIFVLRWMGAQYDPYLSAQLRQMECEIEYMTEGTAADMGMDRGQMLAEMDMELMAMLKPNTATKLNYAQSPPTEMETQVFWTEASFQPVKAVRDRLLRRANVFVFSYQEPGEL